MNTVAKEIEKILTQSHILRLRAGSISPYNQIVRARYWDGEEFSFRYKQFPMKDGFVAIEYEGEFTGEWVEITAYNSNGSPFKASRAIQESEWVPVNWLIQCLETHLASLD